jgi:succinate dehydrogenase / fumarate reductase, cytochrome b subunit
MSTAKAIIKKPRPKYYDLNLMNLPLAGLVSIFHRITGMVLFLFFIPAALYITQSSLSSEANFQHWKLFFAHPIVKLIIIGIIWAYVHHFCAGIRYLVMDMHIAMEKNKARTSAQVVLISGVVITALIGLKIW